jgi:two-component system, LuxR family, response regulator FixJ
MATGSKVYIVDDDEAVRDSLQALLEAKGYAVEAFGSAEAFLAGFKPGGPACALVDVRMPGMDGLTLLGRVKQSGMAVPIIVVTGHGDIPLAVRAMRDGAVDFIEKPYSNEAILDLVRRAHETAQAGPPAGAAASPELAGKIAALTPRERDVLHQLVVGNPNKVIAYELKISPRTVEIHRANLMKKMQAESLSHLVRMALAAGISEKAP